MPNAARSHAFLVAMLIAAAGPASADLEGQPESCEFRVVQWNAAGLDDGFDNYLMPIKIAETVIGYVNQIDANVITLQELQLATVTHLEASLPGWTCHAFDVGHDYVAACVDGPASNFASVHLGDYGQSSPIGRWWGYAQLEYNGKLITSVHTMAGRVDLHVRDLHRDVRTGISGGDLNHIAPEVAPVIEPEDADLPIWYQTELTGLWTHHGQQGQRKIDHILSIDEPAWVWGDLGGEDRDGSNHRVVLAEIIYPRVGPDITIGITNETQPVEVDGGCGASVEFEITLHDGCCLDPDDLGLSVEAENPTTNATLGAVSIDGVTAIGPRDVTVTGRVDVSALVSCPAEVRLEATARDCAGNEADSASQGTGASVFVIDTIRPVVTPGTAELACLWPPNHGYVCFEADEFAPTVADNCDVTPSTWSLTSCSSSQPDNGVGDGDTVDDCLLSTDGQGFCARAERAGNVPAGRRYFPAISATDACGNVSVEADLGSILVPHRKTPAMSCLAPGAP